MLGDQESSTRACSSAFPQLRMQRPALGLAITLAKTHRAALSLYVFAPPLAQPLLTSIATASVWVASETERLEEMTSSAMRSASDAIARASMEVVAEHAGAPFEARDYAAEILAKIKAAADKIGVIAETVHVPDSRPAEAILESAARHGCSLIVMASHGRRGISRLLLGSQTAEVVAHSPVPVLVVR
jgi:nucleotide-binding universal stress UspA family protein